MKILIVSDTHNNIILLEKVLASNKADILFHLGDNYEDPIKVDFSKYCNSLYRVPGIYHPGYADRSLQHIESLDLLGFNLKLVHNIEDINFCQKANQIIFYGHTHVHNVQKYKSNILINPGHLKSLTDRNQPASYLIMTVVKSEIIIDMYRVNSGLKKTYKIKKEKDNKLELFI